MLKNPRTFLNFQIFFSPSSTSGLGCKNNKKTTIFHYKQNRTKKVIIILNFILMYLQKKGKDHISKPHSLRTCCDISAFVKGGEVMRWV